MESLWRNKINQDSVYVIGNGESRLAINLNDLSKYNTIGCNAIHRDFVPDHLVCCDRRMVEESLNNPKTEICKIYTRKDWYVFFKKVKKNKNVFPVPDLPYQGKHRSDQPEHWGSGNYALLLAALNYKNIYLIGFDLYDKNNKINNVYKDTLNYSPKNSKPVDPSYWIYQNSRIFDVFPDKEFIIVNNSDWIMPSSWCKDNVKKTKFIQFTLAK